MSTTKNETVEEFYARLYPAEKQTCKDCGRKNKVGESFRSHPNWLVADACPECYNKVMEEKAKLQKEEYASGESEPCSTEEITCPYCGYEMCDSWEYNDDEDDIECGDCEKTFSYVREMVITYSSSRID